MVLKKTDVINYLSALTIFIIVESPSLKGVFYSTSLFNFLPIFLLLAIIFIKSSVSSIYLFINYSIVPLFLFFLILCEYVFILNFGFPDLTDFFKYIVLLILSLILPFAISYNSLNISFWFIVLWGVFLSIKKLFFNVVFTDEFHYLTLGFSISIMIIISFFKIIYTNKIVLKILFLLCIFLGYLSLLTLFGRSPLLFPTLLILSYFIIKFFQSLKKFNYLLILRYLFILFIFILTIYQVIQNFLPIYLIEKFASISNGSDDSRTETLFKPALNSILSNPLGTGLGSSPKIIGFYPHNIFLEIGIDSGFLGILLFVLLIVITINYSLKILKFDIKKSSLIILVYMFWLIFLFWNVSYGLSSAYAFFSFLTLIINYKVVK